MQNILLIISYKFSLEIQAYKFTTKVGRALPPRGYLNAPSFSCLHSAYNKHNFRTG